MKYSSQEIIIWFLALYLQNVCSSAIIEKGTDRRSGDSAPERGDLYGDLRVLKESLIK